jgi:hypothetical protein
MRTRTTCVVDHLAGVPGTVPLEMDRNAIGFRSSVALMSDRRDYSTSSCLWLKSVTEHPSLRYPAPAAAPPAFRSGTVDTSVVLP